MDGHGYLALLVALRRRQLFGGLPVLTGNECTREERQPSMTLPVKISAREQDTALLTAVAAGDRRALEELYLGYHRRLARLRGCRRHG